MPTQQRKLIFVDDVISFTEMLQSNSDMLQSDCYFQQSNESSVKCDALPPEVNKTPSDMQSVVVNKPHHMAW